MFRPFSFAVLDIHTSLLVEDVISGLEGLWYYVLVELEECWKRHPHIAALVCHG